MLSDEVRERKMRATANATASRRISIVVENIKTNEKWEYVSLAEAGEALGVSRAAVSQALLNNRLLKKTYSITKKDKKKIIKIIKTILSVKRIRSTAS